MEGVRTKNVQLMPKGGKHRFFIPSALAYGKRGAGADIKIYSALVFEIDFVKIQAGQ